MFHRRFGRMSLFTVRETLRRTQARLPAGFPAYIPAVAVGVILGGLVLVLPFTYLVFALGGLVFLYLLIFKIEYAVIMALFVQNQLTRFNYLGRGTPFHPNGIMGIALIGGAVFYFAFHKIDFSRFRSISAFLGFFAVSGLSLIGAGVYLMDGVGVFLRLAAALSIYAILLHKLDSIKLVKWVLAAVIGAQVIPTLSGLMMVAGTSGFLFTDDTMRLGNSGVGVYLSMISTLCLVFLLSRKSPSGWLFWGMLTVFFLTGLFFSYGRSGWIGFVAAVIVMSLIRYKPLIFVFPFLLIIILLLIPAFSQRFSDISFSTQDDGTTSTLEHRLGYWRAALEIHPNHPILGVGYGVGRYVVGDYRNRYPNMIHNDYISVLLETGIVGLILFILWQVQWLYGLARAYRTVTDDFDKAMTLAVLVAFIATLVMRITDNIVLDSFDMYPLCALVAAALVIPRIRAAEGAARAPGISTD